ncbi:diguanylate cyclase [Pseudomonas sp. DC3200b2]|uniref:GGDEF domain-containing protein n=1 Tax=Pseudomonas sp. DC3200b2 TaxID=2804669 RepID=UPI003CF6A113
MPPSTSIDLAERRARRMLRLLPLFTLSVIGIIIALEGLRLWHDYRRVIGEANASATNLARAAAQNVEDALRQVDSMSGGITERIEGDGLANLRASRLHALLKRQVELLPQLHGLFIYGADGRWLVTDKAQIPPNANNADREYFAWHRTHADRLLHVGPVIISRSTGDPVIPVSRRINNPDGSFAGVFLATLRLAYFQRFYAGFQIDDQGTFVVALADGTLLMRHPALPGISGRDLGQSPLFRDYLPRVDSGVVELDSPLDGIRRIYGFRRVDGYPVVIQAGLSRQTALQPLLLDVIKTALVLGVLCCGIGLFGAALLRQFRYRLVIEGELRAAHESLNQMAYQDGLTGLANRRRLDLALNDELSRARRLRYPVALIMLDLDRFKLFNDRYGHPAGDHCLVAVAGALKATAARSSDLAVRYGGEEMALLLPNTPFQGACKVADDLLQRIRALAIAHQDNERGVVTASLGIYVCHPAEQAVQPADLIKATDALLYAAKHSGRDRWRGASAGILAQGTGAG